MRAFMDASAWIPLQIRRDQHALRLREILLEIDDGALDLVTTNWTLYEALATTARWGHGHAKQLYSTVEAECEVVGVDDVVETKALSRFLAWADKSASVVDHANLLVALDEGCDALVSFDSDFAALVPATGLRLLR